MPGKDPCNELLALYTSCVESKQKEVGGLRDGDECKPEGDSYKACRKSQKAQLDPKAEDKNTKKDKAR